MSFFDKLRVVMAALHDVSKHDDQRLDPKANASDTRAQRDATDTTSIHPVTDATTTKGFLKTGSGRILGNDGSNNIGLFGFDSAGNMVVKVAQPGFDADTASDDELIFNSAQNVFKIVKTDTIVQHMVFTSGVDQTITVAHNLGFAPVPIVYGNWASNKLVQVPFIPNGFLVNSGGNLLFTLYVMAYVDTTNLYILFKNGGNNTSLDWTFRYYLLQETAT